ncbi:fish-egg lectin-like [Hyperolius riggenbachi]|uniref:fish-egg lectin-like n=1 Tax=Hyperolius riggenbachi TaxID=752182 RepID=UPI0035A3C12E
MLFVVSLLLLCSEVFCLPTDFMCSLMPGKLKQIDAGAGEVYGVDNNDDIYHLVNDAWKPIPGKLKHVTVGPAGVWGVSAANQVYRIENGQCKLVPGSLKQVDAGGPRFIAGVNSANGIICSSKTCPLSDISWVNLEGGLKYYSCGGLGCWGVNADNRVYYRSGISPTSCQGSGWQEIEGRLVMMEVGSDYAVYGVSPDGDIYRRYGITVSNPAGTGWAKLNLAETYKHVTFDDFYLWLINMNGEILRCQLAQCYRDNLAYP